MAIDSISLQRVSFFRCCTLLGVLVFSSRCLHHKRRNTNVAALGIYMTQRLFLQNRMHKSKNEVYPSSLQETK